MPSKPGTCRCRRTVITGRARLGIELFFPGCEGKILAFPDAPLLPFISATNLECLLELGCLIVDEMNNNYFRRGSFFQQCGPAPLDGRSVRPFRCCVGHDGGRQGACGSKCEALNFISGIICYGHCPRMPTEKMKHRHLLPSSHPSLSSNTHHGSSR